MRHQRENNKLNGFPENLIKTTLKSKNDMDREIKFRAWDNDSYMSKPINLYDMQFGKTQFTKDCIIMQYTGLKDKHGKEIYEGDIVQLIGKPSYKYTICFENCGFYCYHISLKDYEEKPMKWGGLWRFAELDFEIKIIGNIYENSELLK